MGISADGAFGPGTVKAVVNFQAANGLAAEGVAAPDTLSKMTAFAKVVKLTVVQAAEAEQATPPKFAWDKVKGWFS